MFSRIQLSPQRYFIGKRQTMSFAQNKTFELWRSFMPHRWEIANMIGKELYSMEVYPAGYFNNFNPANEFEKWATVEVTDLNNVPAGMETLTAPVGLYAVFIHKGPASDGPITYQYIFQSWLPTSEYLLDERPHFAIMGDMYQAESADSEEDIWIPVKLK